MSVPARGATAHRPVEQPPLVDAPEAPVLAYNQQDQDHHDLSNDLDNKLTLQPSTPTIDPLGEWKLKEITWPDPRIGGFRRSVKVLTQNANGPCSLLALANVLILRGSIHISASLDRISYSALSTLIADFLVTRPQLDNPRGLTLQAALNILPTTVKGLNVNVGFDDIKSFQATEGSSDELALFDLAGVDLVHGWIADTGSGEEWHAMKRAGVATYDGVQETIIKGLDGDGQASADATVLQHFLQSTGTQLTFPGLFALNALEPGSVVAFFRNSHLSVLYRRHNPPPTDSAADSSPTLYQLVTDQSFASEPEITWESIVDIDGAGTSYYNSEFFPASSAGGDYSGMSAGEVVRREEREEARLRGQEGEYRGSLEDQTDLQLARALQEEEDRLVAEEYRDHEQQRQRRENMALDPSVRARAAPRDEAEGDAPRGGRGKRDKSGKKGCCVM